jgi:hypothetical protein
MKKLTLIALLLFSLAGKSQVLDKNQLVQFSGVIVTADSLQPIPFSSIMIRNTSRGTVSDYYGFFSFVAKIKDTIEFAALGFKKATFVIPDTLTDNRCSMIQILKPDTILLKEVVIFPWPTKEQFKEAFIRLHVPDDDLTRAEKNLDPEQIGYLAANMPMDGSMNFKNYMADRQTRLYYAGQLPPTNILDPIKWAKFIQMWQSGAFKKKEKKYKDEN